MSAQPLTVGGYLGTGRLYKKNLPTLRLAWPPRYVDLGHPRWKTIPEVLAWLLAVTGATDTNRAPLGFSSAPDQDPALDHSPDPDIFLDLDGYLTIHFNPFLSTLTSSDPTLSSANEPLCLCLFFIFPPCILSRLLVGS